uniref:Forkhead box protein G1 n=1 Tax=Ficedula albicollis TaxID=59894 RepID=A0A803VXS9_FICAL
GGGGGGGLRDSRAPARTSALLASQTCCGWPTSRARTSELCHYIDIPPSPASSAALPLSPPLPGDTDYKNNAHLKPPYSYATLICMAMEASEEPKLTLAAICKWISDNFCYFRRAHPTWQSSIRHNLCINKRFVKVPREKGEPGRGAFWKLHPQYAEWLRSGTPKGRGTPPERVPAGSCSLPVPRPHPALEMLCQTSGPRGSIQGSDFIREGR